MNPKTTWKYYALLITHLIVGLSVVYACYFKYHLGVFRTAGIWFAYHVVFHHLMGYLVYCGHISLFKK